jgi:hypothetical protein
MVSRSYVAVGRNGTVAPVLARSGHDGEVQRGYEANSSWLVMMVHSFEEV